MSKQEKIIFFNHPIEERSPLFKQICQAYRQSEDQCLQQLLDYLAFDEPIEEKINQTARKLVEKTREKNNEITGIEALMRHYDLSTAEGILLMCLAEALLRIPDKETEQLLIRDKLTSAAWQTHLGASQSSFVNMATWGLALSGKVLKAYQNNNYFKQVWHTLIKRSGEPIIRQAVRQAMKVLSEQFVLGRTITEALQRSQSLASEGYTFSYDMLGEAAHTQKDADDYFEAYHHAISALHDINANKDLNDGASISIKLTALHPRYEFDQQQNTLPALIARVTELVRHAKKHNVAITIDAEETERLEISLQVIEALFNDPQFSDWPGLGLALQAYQKRAFYVIDWLIDLARQKQKKIQVRLVKGAYWDSEIKAAQVLGLVDYPVFTRKSNTDVSYLACAKKLLSAQDAIYPQFATHNAYSVAAILTVINQHTQPINCEFQNLQGMGKALHHQIVSEDNLNLPCRIYAPVGSHEDLLPYLVRRLLENGANSSFVNRIADSSVNIDQLIQSPVKKAQHQSSAMNPHIPLPADLFGDNRRNSHGIDLTDWSALNQLASDFDRASHLEWHAKSSFSHSKQQQSINSPSQHDLCLGHAIDADIKDVTPSTTQATTAYQTWHQYPVGDRAAILRRTADLYEQHQGELMWLAVREAGKSLSDAIAEVREAVDFCRYYALQAEKLFLDQELPGPTGERNVLRMRGRGPILCISPWNFPLAIFTGQIAAALVCGNSVIAKPAEQTPLIAQAAVNLFYQAGLPKDVLQLMMGPGETLGQALVNDSAICGVMFTGSNETARAIQLALAQRPGPIVPFIAETGGINAMIADSSALPEQLVVDIISSAFDSAGQRCSALRLLVIQEDIADHVLDMLAGAMEELVVGDPMLLETDVGPVIDQDAHQRLLAHIADMKQQARLIKAVKLPQHCATGYFVAPHAFELKSISQLKKEVFGPILHVVRYNQRNLDQVLEEINNLGYGLTFGIQSRINTTVDYIQNRMHVGNIYVNRNIIGAVVGVQPFGGCKLSGTGPKAGGPHYLTRLCTENTLSIDTTAAGGNASLMALED